MGRIYCFLLRFGAQNKLQTLSSGYTWLTLCMPLSSPDILTDTFMSCLCISSLDEQWVGLRFAGGWVGGCVLLSHSLVTHDWLADGKGTQDSLLIAGGE